MLRTLVSPGWAGGYEWLVLQGIEQNVFEILDVGLIFLWTETFPTVEQLNFELFFIQEISIYFDYSYGRRIFGIFEVVCNVPVWSSHCTMAYSYTSV